MNRILIILVMVIVATNVWAADKKKSKGKARGQAYKFQILESPLSFQQLHPAIYP